MKPNKKTAHHSKIFIKSNTLKMFIKNKLISSQICNY